MHRILPFFGIIFIAVTPLSAQVIINEYSASNLESFYDNYGKTEDWIELYNSGDQAVDLSGYHLSDKESKPGKWEIPAGTIIQPGDYLLFWCSGRDEVSGGNFHTNFKFAQTKDDEVVLFSDPNEIVLEMYPLELTLVEHSRCRTENGETPWYVSINPSPGYGNPSSAQYLGYTQTPEMDQEAGYYQDTVLVTLTNNEPGSILRYTLDGTNPTLDSPEYSEPLLVDQTTVIKARSFSEIPDILPGKMDFNTYFINEDFSLVVFSVAADEVIDLANGDGSLIPIGSIEYFNKDKERAATSFGSLNRHGQDSWALPHRSLDWVSRDEMGYSKAVQAELFGYSDRDEYQKFMFRNSGDDNYPAVNDNAHQGSTHVRDEYVQTLAMQGGLKLDTRAVERVVLFLNGEYWGVYGMRERPVDHDYTGEYYDQGKYDLHYLSTWGSTEAEYGGDAAFADWIQLRDFILQNDMGDPVNYEIVKDQYQMLSLIDYMIVNLNCVASDWLNYNTGWWRGLDPEGDHKKWGYILWDLDATFDYYINYSGVPNTSPTAEPCDIEDISDYMDEFFDEVPIDVIPNPEDCPTILSGNSPYPVTDSIFIQVINEDHYCCETEWDGICQDAYDNLVENPGGNVNTQGNVGKHEKIFLKLQEESETFRQLYFSRQADLQNTVYTCENMLETLDSMLAVIHPEMPRQIERWGGSMLEWTHNVNELKDFIELRCELLDEGMIECFDLSGPYELTLKVEPEGAGSIELNTIDLESFPWSGFYYGGMDNLIEANSVDEELYVFSHWESAAGSTIFPDVFDEKAKIQLTTQDTLTAVFTSLVKTNEVDPGITFSVFPNPATDQVILNYELDEAMEIKVNLFSSIGEMINLPALPVGKKSAGKHTEMIGFKGILPPGVYWLNFTTGEHRLTRKITVI